MRRLEIPGAQVVQLDPATAVLFQQLQMIEKLLEALVRERLGVPLEEALQQTGVELRGLEPAEEEG